MLFFLHFGVSDQFNSNMYVFMYMYTYICVRVCVWYVYTHMNVGIAQFVPVPSDSDVGDQDILTHAGIYIHCVKSAYLSHVCASSHYPYLYLYLSVCVSVARLSH
jgi:hypothetical protein